MTELITRAYEFRADNVDADKREIVGLAVPYERDAEIGGNYVERIARDAVGDDSNTALLFWRHSEPIGRLIEAKSTDDGWEIRARISETAVGNDALTLVRDGVATQLSIGFEALEDAIETREDGMTVITRKRIAVREVSIVPFGAYADGASITEVRERNNPTTENRSHNMTDSTTDAPDLTEVRERLDEIERRSAEFITRDDAPVTDTRSAAEILKALAKGDDATVRQVNALYERAYTGGTTADTVALDGWVGDLTRIYDQSSGALSNIFGSGTLPAQGMSIEYAQLKGNTIQVTEQANEGDDLAYGKVQLETKTAPVKTLGGYTQLSRQEIERGSLPIVQRSLEALAIAAGAAEKSIVRSAFNSLVTARTAIASNGGVVLLGATLGAATYNNWVSALVDAAIKYDDLNLDIDALVVSGTVFKKLASFAGSDGRPMLSLDGSGANTVGRLNVKELNGSIAGVPVILDAGQSGDAANFVSERAITVYKSPIVSLQDENIVNLSKDFSVYRYAAVAPEVPAGVVPIKLAAS